MQITSQSAGGVLEMALAGRLDAYWTGDLDNTLATAIREGHHHLRLDLSAITFLSSAGISSLMKFYKQLKAIDGTFVVVNPSASVRLVLEMTRLSAVFMGPESHQTTATVAPRSGQKIERSGITFDVYDRPGPAGLRCRVIGNDQALLAATFSERDSVSLGATSPALALGVGAFGENFGDCRNRFGELISVAGATGYQPADGTNVPDYLLATGPLPDDVQMLYGLVCEGQFGRLAHFEAQQSGAPVGMLPLLEAIADLADTPLVGFVMVTETAGLVGAALRRSPAEALADRDFFSHPGVRSRLSFTSERAFPRSTAVVAGVLAKGSAAGVPCVRPIGTAGLSGHVHAAAFPYRPLRKGEVDLKESVSALFEHEQLLGVLHLLHDDRGPAGAGESEFVRGACWVAPIVAPVEA